MSVVNTKSTSNLLAILIIVSMINVSSSQFGLIFDVAGCIGKTAQALVTCEQYLQDRLEVIDKASEKISDVEVTMFSCCYLAEFSHCLNSKTEGKCGSQISKVLESGTSSITKALNSKCEAYDYYSPTCLFVVYLNYIMVFGAIMAVMCVVALCRCLRIM